MEIEKLQINPLVFAMKGLKNKGLIDVSEDSATGDYVVIVGQAIHRQWGVFSIPKGIWRVTCKKEEVKEVVDKLLLEKVLTE
jgi:hypothetical protein